MEVKLIIFGQLTEIIGSGNLILNNVVDTDDLVKHLQDRYPAIAKSKYIIAVNKQVIKENTVLNADSIVALLPPFSGG